MSRKPTYQPPTSTPHPGDFQPRDISTLKIPTWLKALIKTGEDVNAEQPYQSRSEALFDAVQGLLKSRIDEQTIMGVCFDSRYAISDKPREKGQSWLASEIARARAKLNGHQTTGGHHTRANGDTTATDPTERRFPTLASISYTAQALQQKVIPDLVEVIPDILPEGLAMIAGGAGLGKSFFCLQVAIDVCRGSKFLGQWPTTTGDVLYLATEDSERRIRDRLRQMWNDEALWPATLTITHRPQTLDHGLIDQLNEWLDEHGQVRLVVIDLFADVRPARKPSGDWYADDRAAAKLLSTLGNTRHLCVLASHHTNRLKSDDPFESFHGGNGLLGAAETKMILQPQQEGQAIWRMKGRDVAEQAYLLRLEEGAWEYVGEALTAKLSASRRDILSYFQNNTGYHSAETVAKALGKKTSTTWNLMNKLCQQRLLVAGDYGRYRLFQRDTL